MARTSLEGQPWQSIVQDRVAEAGLMLSHLGRLAENAAYWPFWKMGQHMAEKESRRGAKFQEKPKE